MILDEPELDNGVRLLHAAELLLRSEPVIVYVYRRGIVTERGYRGWLEALLRERGHSSEHAAVLACGASIRIE